MKVLHASIYANKKPIGGVPMGYFTDISYLTCFYIGNHDHGFVLNGVFSPFRDFSSFFCQGRFQGLFHQSSRLCSHLRAGRLCESSQQRCPRSFEAFCFLFPHDGVGWVKTQVSHSEVVVGTVPRLLKVIQTWYPPFNEVVFPQRQRYEYYFTQNLVTSRILLICASMIGVLFGQ